MKALTLWQPWASLIAVGAKTIETRSWATSYRGPLAIHAGNKIAMVADSAFLETMVLFGMIAKTARDRSRCHWCWQDIPGEPPPICTHDYSWSHRRFSRGVVLGWCELTDCQEMTEANILATPSMDRLFGDFRPGRYAWMLGPFHALESPVPCRGRQGLWDFHEA